MAGLGMLKPFNAGAQAATIFKDRNPGALQVAMGRNNAEDKMAQDMLAAKVAAKGEADKQKEANKGEAAKNLNALAKESVFRYHGPTYKAALNGYIDEYAQASMLHAQQPDKYSDPDDPGTEAGVYFFKKQADLGQMVKSSKDIQASHDATMAYMQAHPEEFTPGAIQAAEAEYANPSHLVDNTVVEKPAHLWNVEKNIAATFAPMEDMVTAWANPTGDGGVASGSIAKPMDGAVKALAESFSSGEWAYPALMKRFEAMEPAAQERISKIAKDNGMSKAGALAMDMAGNLYGATKQEAGRTAPNETGRRAKEDEATARELIENVRGLVSGAAQDKKGYASDDQKRDFLDELAKTTKNRFDVKPEDVEVFTNLNGRTYTNTHEPKAANNMPGKIKGIVRFPNGDVVVAYDNLKTNSLGKGTIDSKEPIKYSERIPKDEAWSRLGIEVAKNDPAYNLGAVETVFERDYPGVKDTWGQVPLGNKPGRLNSTPQTGGGRLNSSNMK